MFPCSDFSARVQHEFRNKSKDMLYVKSLTGLSGCGKSTVSNLVDRKLYERKVRSFVLDGDNVRHGLNAPPAILLASQLTNHLLHEALGMHVFSVLSKPVDLNLLLDALARVMRRHYASRWPNEG